MEDDQNLPCKIADIVFNQEPSLPKSVQLICETETKTSIEPLDLFEIFMNIMLEGLFIKIPDLNKNLMDSFNEGTLKGLSPWLQSLGYDVDVVAVPRKATEEYEHYYCKIILKCDPEWTLFFKIQNIENKKYHFVFGGKSPYIRKEECKLSNLFAIFVHKNDVFKISFRCI
jgi:hypothetical protein